MKVARFALLLGVASAPLPAWASGAANSAGSPKVKKFIELQKAPLSNQDLDEIGAKRKVLQGLLSKEEAMFAERQRSYEPIVKKDALLQTVNHGTAEQTQAAMEKLATKEQLLRGIAGKEEALFAERQRSYKPLAKKGALLQTEVHLTAEQTQAEMEKLAKKRKMLEGLANEEEAMFAERQRSYKPLVKTGAALLQAEVHVTAEQTQAEMDKLAKKKRMLEGLASKEEAMFAERQRSYKPLVKTGAALLQTVSHASAGQTQAEMEKLAKKEKMLQSLEGQEEATFAERQKTYKPLAKTSGAFLQTVSHANAEQTQAEMEKLAEKEKMLQSLEGQEEAAFANRQKTYQPLSKKSIALLQTANHVNTEQGHGEIEKLATKEKMLQSLESKQEAMFAERQRSYEPVAGKGALLQTVSHATAERTQAKLEQLAHKEKELQRLVGNEEALFAERQKSYKPLVKTGASLLQAEVHATAEQTQTEMEKLAKKKRVLEGLVSKEEAMFAERQRSYKPLVKTGAAFLQTVSRAAAKQTQAEMDKLAKKEKMLRGVEKQEEATFAERQKTFKPLTKTSGAFLQTVSHATAEETQSEMEKLARKEKMLQSLESHEEAAFASRQKSYQSLAKTA